MSLLIHVRVCAFDQYLSYCTYDCFTATGADENVVVVAAPIIVLL